MPEFRVRKVCSQSFTTYVEAEDEDQACALAEKLGVWDQEGDDFEEIEAFD